MSGTLKQMILPLRVTYSAGYSSQKCHRAFELARSGRIFSKMMGNARRGKFPGLNLNALELSEKKVKGSIGKSGKRLEVFNALFMEQITDLVSTGEANSKFLGFGLQISKVKVSPDFSCVHVFWYTNTEKMHNELEALLNSTGAEIQHKLTQRKVVGMVPNIKFVKDDSYVALQRLEYLFKKCSFQEIYKSNRSKFLLNSNSSASSNDTQHETEAPLDLREMRNDLLGVDHAAIMNKLLRSIKRKKPQGQDWLDDCNGEKNFNSSNIQMRAEHEKRRDRSFTFKQYLRSVKSKQNRTANENWIMKSSEREFQMNLELSNLGTDHDADFLDDYNLNDIENR